MKLNRFAIPLACALLASCNGGNLAPVAASLIPAADLAKVQSVCSKAGPALNFASLPAMPAVVSGTAIDAAAFCNAIASGSVPPTADSNSSKWLDRIVAVLPAVAQAAGVLLPMLL